MNDNSRIVCKQRGFALFMGLIFLLMITLVAVTAMRGTSLELSMANNTANHEEAFEGAESARMATVRILRDHAACSFRFGLGAVATDGTSCRVGCTNGKPSTENTASFPWEPRLTVDDWERAKVIKRDPSENSSNPKTYIDRFAMRYGPANAGTAHVGTFMVDAVAGTGEGALMMNAYEGASGSSAQGTGSTYIDVAANAEVAQARASVAGHYRLLTRETGPGSCLNNGNYGPS